MKRAGRASLNRLQQRIASASLQGEVGRSPGLLLRSVRIDPAHAGDRLARLPFLAGGQVAIEFGSPLTLLVGENGSGKTTLLEAIAARCGIQPGGGDSYAETEDERDTTALSDAIDVTITGGWRPRGLFLRADRLADTMAHAGRLPMPLTGEWRLADEQSRGEGVLSLLSARVDASERMLFLLDEPETGLSPQRQLILLALLDELHRDGRSQAIVVTHSPILLSHPGCDRLWIDGDGIARRDFDDIPHWREMRRFGGTLWREVGRDGGASDHASGEPIEVEAADGRRAMTLGDVAVHHARTRGLIEAAIARPGDGRLVIVTHDPPSADAASSLRGTGRVAAWIQGHAHRTSDAVRSDALRVVCNAAGPGFGNFGFLDDLVIEV